MRPIPMPPAFDPQEIEAGWYARWQEAHLFEADPASPKPKFSIAVPPPNVTGELHMGHATNLTIQDVWSRYRRMTGYEVLWLPGMDHAAIATQNVIERQLADEGTTKEELGRAAFESRVDEWYQEVGATILVQAQDLGASMDFRRTRFTMDERYVRAVRTAFVRFYEKGWIYRGLRIVNWCPQNLSGISDLEVDWQTHHDTLYHIRYPVEGGGSVEIATVRPETMLADTAVAVHPDDPRFRDLVGRSAILPLVGRRLPIVADVAVEREFGTGALKVTPGHDPMDYEIGLRHGLPVINGMHPDGRMNVPDLPAYDGKPGVEARAYVVRDLEAGGFLVRTEPYTHEVGHCDRCGAVIEPMVSEQWWLKQDEMVAKALQATAERRIRWHPERYERTYLDWLRGLRDWNVGRQLWLGHRVPVYHCPNGHRFAAVDPPQACQECGAAPLTEDPDVLDTWFSSALWPFATLGWPDQTAELSAFYPTSLNSTAREIINLWVSRMIMTGLELMGEVPFSEVAIHCVIQTADGQRMSKSKNNVIDPRMMVRKYGADALRAWAASVAMSSQDVRFDESRIEGFKRFSNKLWNATRLVLAGLGAETPAHPVPGAQLELMDRWILSRLQATVTAVTAGIEEYAFQSSVASAYDFAWHDFCDWYLEATKSRLRDGDPAARAVCVLVLDVLLRLLHPFMPFVSEELWHRLPGERGFVMQAGWPEAASAFGDPSAEEQVAGLIGLVEEIRAARQAASAGPKGGWIQLDVAMDPERLRLVAELARIEVVDEVPGQGIPLAQSAARVAFPAARAEGSGRQQAELERLRGDLARAHHKLSNPEFRAKAPAEVVAREEGKAAELAAAIARLQRD